MKALDRVSTLAAISIATVLFAACANTQGPPLSAAPAKATKPAVASAPIPTSKAGAAKGYQQGAKRLSLPGKPTLRVKGESFYLNVTKELLERFIATNKLRPLKSWPQTLTTGLRGYTAPPSFPNDRLQTAAVSVSTTFSVSNNYIAIYYNTKHRYLVIQP